MKTEQLKAIIEIVELCKSVNERLDILEDSIVFKHILKRRIKMMQDEMDRTISTVQRFTHNDINELNHFQRKIDELFSELTITEP